MKSNEKPGIYVSFDGDECNWLSDGWSDDPRLMAEARRAIIEATTPREVIKLLNYTFEVYVAI